MHEKVSTVLLTCGALLGGVLVSAPVANAMAPQGPSCVARHAARADDPGDNDPDSPTPSDQAVYDAESEAGLAAKGGHADLAAGSVNVPVYVHVVTDGAKGELTKQDVADSMDRLNKAYAGSQAGAATAFTFTLKGFGTIDDAALASITAPDGEQANAQQRPTMTALRAEDSDAATLNIYVVPNVLDEHGKSGNIAGYATLPQWYRTSDTNDGVVMQTDFMLSTPANTGTLPHQVGHWLGLYHTFQGGCDAPGDEVDDTPYQADPTSGKCPEGLDSCPAPGEDPIHNFMNDAASGCRDRFTPGQAQRAADQWVAFRQRPELDKGKTDLFVIGKSGEATAGKHLAYTFTVDNGSTATATATGTVLQAGMPAQLSGLTVSGATGCTINDAKIMCPLGDLPAGDSRKVTVTGKIAARATGGIQASVAVADTSGNATGTRIVNIVTASTDLRATVTSTAPVRRKRVTYTATVTNTGPSDATGVVLTLTLPVQTTGTSRVAGCLVRGAQVRCNWPALAAGAHRKVTGTATVKPATKAKTAITVRATATSTTADPNLRNNTANNTSKVK
ncbi:DUF11 domain-containing protein [Actinomadura barringtoniae]|uniref:DUF11 domain-containing protein n=1 Tax=Actinomadura barringtoniae TaxID=1427535 RepID=A0A939PK93_9ACTN|nr:M43 family zinc metalloprotease [Actinomadura barringtoniae]MBO2451638.1 DUF11 domain-containing protein [Actinomadura barringtoniae]